MVTMVTEVLHNSCNVCTSDLPDVCSLSPWAHSAYQGNPSCLSYIYILLLNEDLTWKLQLAQIHDLPSV